MKVVCSAVQTMGDDEKEFSEWPSDDCGLNAISPFRLRLYQLVIRRAILWAIKYIDVQVDSLTVVVRDEEVSISVSRDRLEERAFSLCGTFVGPRRPASTRKGDLSFGCLPSFLPFSLGRGSHLLLYELATSLPLFPSVLLQPYPSQPPLPFRLRLGRTAFSRPSHADASFHGADSVVFLPFFFLLFRSCCSLSSPACLALSYGVPCIFLVTARHSLRRGFFSFRDASCFRYRCILCSSLPPSPLAADLW